MSESASSINPAHYVDHEHGITTIDTGFERDRFDAAYLIVEQGRAAFIDSGINASLPRLLGALTRLDLTPSAVDWVIVTHVHLDHAGGAGALLAACPKARFVVHPRGARHMINPEALMAGASAVYGDEVVAATYGQLVPVPEDRVVSPADGETLMLCERPLLFIDTPGHAKHHHCIWDARSQAWFTGDTFGISYPELATLKGRYLFPTTTPVQFDPVALHQSLRRMEAHNPKRLFPTHFDALDDVAPLARRLHAQIDELVTLARKAHHQHGAAPERHEAIKTSMLGMFQRHYRAMGGALADEALHQLLTLDLELNAQGLGVWLDRPSN